MKILEPYLNDTNCLTSKRKEISRRLKGWKHLRAEEGIRSKVANDYYILATPVMVLLNANTKEIIAVPNTMKELVTAAK